MSDEVICQLCRSKPPIKNSHVIPAFVYRALKKDSPTGYLRSSITPNRRVQDGKKLPLLCEDCEVRFSDAEREFSTKIFDPFHNHDQDRFEYGPWLHYFMTSLAWRTLILEIPDFQSNEAIPKSLITRLTSSRETMEQYLLGASNLGKQIRNHAFPMTEVVACSPDLARIGPNASIRRCAFGLTIMLAEEERAGVIHNLAGFACFLIIKGDPHDRWEKTRINSGDGAIEPPQRVDSWLMTALLNTVIEEQDRKRDLMSDVQRAKTIEATNQNLSARSLRFRDMDKRITIDQPESNRD